MSTRHLDEALARVSDFEAGERSRIEPESIDSPALGLPAAVLGVYGGYTLLQAAYERGKERGGG